MDEKTAMNVEFLRARLLSERIVSRTAKQRSEMLAKRVIELEEQLRIVNIQRKKAEKAAEEVLSILETQGITCIQGLTDSSTDHEDDQHNDQEGNQCMLSKDIKEDEYLTLSKLDGSKVDDGFSCSDYNGPSPEYNCLSWKSQGSSLDSQGKQKTKQSRHRQNNSFIITMKSSKRCPGKSCRKIKKHNGGSASEIELEKSPLIDAHGNGVVSHPDDFDENHECLLEASESKMENFSVDPSALCSDNQSKESKDVCEKDDGMERALEQQAQLIIQFQSMENAQRIWEEKFNETKMSMLENPESGNQVNTAENAISSAENSNLLGWIPRHEEEEKLSVKDISFTEDKATERCRNCEMENKRVAPETTAINVIETVNVPKAFTLSPQESPGLTRKVHQGTIFKKPIASPISNKKVHPHQKNLSGSEQQYDTVFANEAKNAKHAIRVFKNPSQENPVSIYEKLGTVNLRNSKAIPPEQGIHHSSSLAEQLTSPITNEKISNRELLKELPRQQSAANSSRLGSVLQSLQRARFSLGHELAKMPSSVQGIPAIPPTPANSSLKPTPSIKALDFPIDSSALFRLPSDSFTQLHVSQPNIYGSGLRLTATRPDLGIINSTVLVSKEYLDQSPSASSPYLQSGSNVSSGKDYVEQYPFNPNGTRVQVRKEYADYYPSQYAESESQASATKDYFDRRSSSSILASSSANEYPLYYPGLSTKRLSLYNESPISSSDSRSRMPFSDRYSYGGNSTFSS